MNVRQVVWVSYRPPGVEFCTAAKGPTGWALKGTLVRRFRKGAALITYLIETDVNWRTRSVSIQEVLRGQTRSLNIEVRRSRWFLGEKEIPALRGCIDVDLEASPVTNSLPINRLGKKGKDLTAAWVRFPTLEVVPLRQSYERLGPKRFRYRSASGFTAEIAVDSFGLIRRYGDYWVAVDSIPS